MVHQFSAKTQNVSDKGSFSEDADGREYPLSTCAVTRRRFSSGCKPHPATAPAGSDRSRHGGDEMSEGHRQLVRSGQPDAGDWQCGSGILLPTGATDFRPDLECLDPGSPVLGGSDVVAAEMEEVVDLIVG